MHDKGRSTFNEADELSPSLFYFWARKTKATNRNYVEGRANPYDRCKVGSDKMTTYIEKEIAAGMTTWQFRSTTLENSGKLKNGKMGKMENRCRRNVRWKRIVR